MKLFTITEASQILSIKPKTLRAWVASRKIGFHKIGGCVRFSEDEIKRLIEESAMPPIKLESK